MTEADRPTDDEIVSAYLDGEATPDEVARLERDPDLQIRLAAFRTGVELVRDVAAPDPAVREAHLHRAAEASATASPVGSVVSLDDAQAAADATSRAQRAPVHDLGEARARRRRTFLLSAAAVVAALVLGAGLLPRLLDEDDPGMTAVGTAADRRSEADRGSEAEADDDRAAAGSTDDQLARPPASTTPDQESAEGLAAAPPPSDLGSFATLDELDVALDAALAAHLQENPSSFSSPAAADASSGCAAAVLAADGELTGLAYQATATVAGGPLEVLVFWTDPASSANGPLRVYLVDPRCDPIAGGVETLVP